MTFWNEYINYNNSSSDYISINLTKYNEHNILFLNFIFIIII